TIAASAGSGGSISPSGTQNVSCAGSQGYAISANGGQHVTDVLVDGTSQGAVTSYSFTNVQANHTIAASFAADAGGTDVVAAAVPGSACISTATSCVTVPVNITRNTGSNMRSYTVGIQLSAN